jgi:hypothetical protein
MGQIFDLLSSIVFLAGLAVVASSSQLAGVIRAFGDFFTGAINAAQTV